MCRRCWLLPLVLLAACASPRPVSAPAPVPPASAARPGVVRADPTPDATLGGMALVGVWDAIRDPAGGDRDRDLQRGTLRLTLAIRSSGQAVLDAEDRASASGALRYTGVVSGARLCLRDMSGCAALAVEGRRLVVTDPHGRQTVYAKRE